MFMFKRTATMLTNGKSHGHVTTGTKQPSNDAYIAVNADPKSIQAPLSCVRASATELIPSVCSVASRKPDPRLDRSGGL